MWEGCSFNSSFTYETRRFWNEEQNLYNYLPGAVNIQIGSLGGDSSIKTLIIGGVLGSARLDRIQFNSSVPEPGTMLLLGTGLAGLVGIGRRRFKK